MRKSLSVFCLLAIIPGLNLFGQQVAYFFPGKQFAGFKVKHGEELVEGISMPRWLWDGPIEMVSDDFPQWIIRRSDQSAVQLSHQVDGDARLVVIAGRLPTEEASYYETIEGYWTAYIERTKRLHPKIQISDVETLSTTRPMLEFIPWVGRFHFVLERADGRRLERIHTIQVSPDSSGQWILISVLDTSPERAAYHFRSASRWLAGFTPVE